MLQDGHPRRVSLVFPIVLITLGALFLFHNWRPAFDPWPILETYWPLILIFIGVGKIWDTTYRSRNPNAPPGVSIGATFGALAPGRARVRRWLRDIATVRPAVAPGVLSR